MKIKIFLKDINIIIIQSFLFGIFRYNDINNKRNLNISYGKQLHKILLSLLYNIDNIPINHKNVKFVNRLK